MATSPAEPVNLTCEYQAHNLGIDTARPRFSWWMNDRRPGAAQTAYHVQVARGGTAFSDDALVWDSGEIASSDSVLIEYAGSALESRTRYAYRVRLRDHREEWGAWSEPDWFETAFLSASQWRARWIAPSDDDGETGGPPPLLRTSFAVEGSVVSARLYASARGLAEVVFNGEIVGTHVLSPGWTDYDRRTQYVTHDVTDLVREGENVLGAILGDGWYSGRIARIKDGERRFGARPQFLCELHVALATGAEVIVCSDESWTWRTGPIVASDIYDGERYDARLELPDWGRSAAGPGWEPARVVGPATAHWSGAAAPSPVLDAKVVPPVRRVKELVPLARTEPEPGKYVFDLGQNIVGWARVRLSGSRDTTITLRFAEMLNPDGTLYVENLRTAKATDTYTCSGDGEFTWEPRFTFHGFRYVEVSGVDDPPEPEQIAGIVLHNDLPLTGSFDCSHPLVNQLQSNIQWGQRGNYLEAPTDCPQRDERLGWTGDAQVFIPTATFNMQVAPFFTKWQRDLADAQGPAGTIPSVAPAVRYMKPSDENDGGPAWSDAFVICPWTIRRRYGDLRIVAEHYDAMYRFVESMRSRSRGLIRSDQFVEGWGGYGDWVAMDAPEGERVGATPKDLIGTAYFAHSTDILRRMAEVLGKDHDVVQLRDLHRRIVRAFRSEFVTPAGRLLGDTQTAYAVALAFDMLPEQMRPAAVDRLVRLLELRGRRLSTGFVGTPLLCPVLTRFGRDDVAYRLLLQEEFPSWLYTVKQGATTMWERWNSYTHEHGFGPVQMNSFNHYAYGSIGDWIYSSVAGLAVDTSEPGEPPLRIAPKPGYGIDRARAQLDTPFGRAASSWAIESGTVRLEVTIPANAWARVVIPAGTSDIEIDADEGEAHLEELVVHEDNARGLFTFRVAAGEYAFLWSLPAAAAPPSA
ncbi:MAG: family 78 glycoside hydrolase catalytic domain [bacterium]